MMCYFSVLHRGTPTSPQETITILQQFQYNPASRWFSYVLKVAHSAEEAMDMILEGFFQVAVVDLHMPRMSGTEFCRRVRTHELEVAASVRSMNIGGRAGQEGEELDEPQASTKLLLHTTSAGSVTFDDLEVCTRG